MATGKLSISVLVPPLSNLSRRFEWKKPGYEYNYKDSPILLILGSERWRELLPEHPQSAPKGTAAEAKMNELLLWSHHEAQKFAEEMKAFHIYA